MKDKLVKGFKKYTRIVIRFVIICYLKVLYLYSVEGKENIPKQGPFIVCANHQSFLDGQLLIATCPRPLDFVVKRELVNNNVFFRFLAWVYDAIPVARNKKDLNAVKVALKDLKNGEALGIFPEGTRNGIEKREPIKDGTAFFAIKSQAPVICCGISGKAKLFSRIKVKYSKPLDLSNFKNPKSEEELRQVTQIIMERIAELADIDKSKLEGLIK